MMQPASPIAASRIRAEPGKRMQRSLKRAVSAASHRFVPPAWQSTPAGVTELRSDVPAQSPCMSWHLTGRLTPWAATTWTEAAGLKRSACQEPWPCHAASIRCRGSDHDALMSSRTVGGCQYLLNTGRATPLLLDHSTKASRSDGPSIALGDLSSLGLRKFKQTFVEQYCRHGLKNRHLVLWDNF
jgi:hypothetical protein